MSVWQKERVYSYKFLKRLLIMTWYALIYNNLFLCVFQPTKCDESGANHNVILVEQAAQIEASHRSLYQAASHWSLYSLCHRHPRIPNEYFVVISLVMQVEFLVCQVVNRSVFLGVFKHFVIVVLYRSPITAGREKVTTFANSDTRKQSDAQTVCTFQCYFIMFLIISLFSYHYFYATRSQHFYIKVLIVQKPLSVLKYRDHVCKMRGHCYSVSC